VRHRILRVAAALATAVLTVSIATPAMAELSTWDPTCSTGAIDRVEVSGDGRLIAMEAHVDCAQSDTTSQAAYGFALYREGVKEGAAHWSVMGLYASTAPSAISIVKDLPNGDFGLCLVTDANSRIECVKVTAAAKGQATTVTPLPTDDPLVDLPVQVYGRDSSTSPACGTCW
jgi:hypothetical protein